MAAAAAHTEERLKISVAQKKAIRAFHRAQEPRLGHKHVRAWFKEVYDIELPFSTISNILSSKFDHLDSLGSDYDDNKRCRPPKYPDLEIALTECILRIKNMGTEVSGSTLLNLAYAIWPNIPKYQDLQCPSLSGGWVEKFKVRHNIKQLSVVGEAASLYPTPLPGNSFYAKQHTTVRAGASNSNHTQTTTPIASSGHRRSDSSSSSSSSLYQTSSNPLQFPPEPSQQFYDTRGAGAALGSAVLGGVSVGIAPTHTRSHSISIPVSSSPPSLSGQGPAPLGLSPPHSMSNPAFLPPPQRSSYSGASPAKYFSTSPTSAAPATASPEVLVASQFKLDAIRSQIAGFQLDDVFTMSETLLSYAAPPTADDIDAATTTRATLGTVTVALACNASGTEQLNPWVIGHHPYPRTYGEDIPSTSSTNDDARQDAARLHQRKVFEDLQSLQVEYSGNSIAWLTLEDYKKWLSWFDAQMAGRRVLLVLDPFKCHEIGLRMYLHELQQQKRMPLPMSAQQQQQQQQQQQAQNAAPYPYTGAHGHSRSASSSHRSHELPQLYKGLENTTVVFLPGNLAADHSPMEFGLLQNFKANYRSTLLWFLNEFYLSDDDDDNSSPQGTGSNSDSAIKMESIVPLRYTPGVVPDAVARAAADIVASSAISDQDPLAPDKSQPQMMGNPTPPSIDGQFIKTENQQYDYGQITSYLDLSHQQEQPSQLLSSDESPRLVSLYFALHWIQKAWSSVPQAFIQDAWTRSKLLDASDALPSQYGGLTTSSSSSSLSSSSSSSSSPLFRRPILVSASAPLYVPAETIERINALTCQLQNNAPSMFSRNCGGGVVGSQSKTVLAAESYIYPPNEILTEIPPDFIEISTARFRPSQSEPSTNGQPVPSIIPIELACKAIAVILEQEERQREPDLQYIASLTRYRSELQSRLELSNIKTEPLDESPPASSSLSSSQNVVSLAALSSQDSQQNIASQYPSYSSSYQQQPASQHTRTLSFTSPQAQQQYISSTITNASSYINSSGAYLYAAPSGSLSSGPPSAGSTAMTPSSSNSSATSVSSTNSVFRSPPSPGNQTHTSLAGQGGSGIQHVTIPNPGGSPKRRRTSSTGHAISTMMLNAAGSSGGHARAGSFSGGSSSVLGHNASNSISSTSSGSSTSGGRARQSSTTSMYLSSPVLFGPTSPTSSFSSAASAPQGLASGIAPLSRADSISSIASNMSNTTTSSSLTSIASGSHSQSGSNAGLVFSNLMGSPSQGNFTIESPTSPTSTHSGSGPGLAAHRNSFSNFGTSVITMPVTSTTASAHQQLQGLSGYGQQPGQLSGFGSQPIQGLGPAPSIQTLASLPAAASGQYHSALTNTTYGGSAAGGASGGSIGGTSGPGTNQNGHRSRGSIVSAFSTLLNSPPSQSLTSPTGYHFTGTGAGAGTVSVSGGGGGNSSTGGASGRGYDFSYSGFDNGSSGSGGTAGGSSLLPLSSLVSYTLGNGGGPTPATADGNGSSGISSFGLQPLRGTQSGSRPQSEPGQGQYSQYSGHQP